jgi:hypothetical protein
VKFPLAPCHIVGSSAEQFLKQFQVIVGRSSAWSIKLYMPESNQKEIYISRKGYFLSLYSCGEFNSLSRCEFRSAERRRYFESSMRQRHRAREPVLCRAFQG